MAWPLLTGFAKLARKLKFNIICKQRSSDLPVDGAQVDAAESGHDVVCNRNASAYTTNTQLTFDQVVLKRCSSEQNAAARRDLEHGEGSCRLMILDLVRLITDNEISARIVQIGSTSAIHEY